MMPWLPEGRTLVVPGRGELFYRSHRHADPAAPTVLLLHGWTATADLQFFTAYEALAARCSFVTLDHRGHGRGLRPEARFELEDAADDAAALVEALGVGPVITVGYSMGGPVSMLLARRHPRSRQRHRGAGDSPRVVLVAHGAGAVEDGASDRTVAAVVRLPALSAEGPAKVARPAQRTAGLCAVAHRRASSQRCVQHRAGRASPESIRRPTVGRRTAQAGGVVDHHVATDSYRCASSAPSPRPSVQKSARSWPTTCAIGSNPTSSPTATVELVELVAAVSRAPAI